MENLRAKVIHLPCTRRRNLTASRLPYAVPEVVHYFLRHHVRDLQSDASCWASKEQWQLRSRAVPVLGLPQGSQERA